MFTRLLEGVDKTLVRNLVILHTLVIAVSNYLVTIRFDLFPGAELPLFGSFPLAAAAFTFPIVVIATDLTVRMVGKQAGRAVVAMAIIPAIVASVLVLLALGDEHAYRVGLASGVAYAVGTMLDVYVFQYIRERMNAWWIAPAVSTIAANIIDTYAFFYTAFYPAPWVGPVAFNNTLTKIVIGLIVFLPAYGILLRYLNNKMQVVVAPVKAKAKAKAKAPAKKKVVKE
ncbi:queuosine precursor transporter [bacterium]|nr:queuosine precursor transporter [bacterium]